MVPIRAMRVLVGGGDADDQSLCLTKKSTRRNGRVSEKFFSFSIDVDGGDGDRDDDSAGGDYGDCGAGLETIERVDDGVVVRAR